MNSEIIDQHFCRDALSISRHVGRRVLLLLLEIFSDVPNISN